MQGRRQRLRHDGRCDARQTQCLGCEGSGDAGRMQCLRHKGSGDTGKCCVLDTMAVATHGKRFRTPLFKCLDTTAVSCSRGRLLTSLGYPAGSPGRSRSARSGAAGPLACEEWCLLQIPSGACGSCGEGGTDCASFMFVPAPLSSQDSGLLISTNKFHGKKRSCV